MTQLEFDFDSSTETVIEAFKFHNERVLHFASLIKDKAFTNHPDRHSWNVDIDYHFEQYQKADAILNDRNVYA